MSQYALFNGYLPDLLEDGTPRPKLQLILRARAKAREPFQFAITGDLISLYRQYGESAKISPAQQTLLESIANPSGRR
jgi:hypothetical protein